MYTCTIRTCNTSTHRMAHNMHMIHMTYHTCTWYMYYMYITYQILCSMIVAPLLPFHIQSPPERMRTRCVKSCRALLFVPDSNNAIPAKRT